MNRMCSYLHVAVTGQLSIYCLLTIEDQPVCYGTSPTGILHLIWNTVFRF